MMNKYQHPKSIAVYESVLAFINEGKSLSELTVSAIAKRAGIGKGTTYDYFSSKEEIICRSVIYGYGRLVQKICEPVLAMPDFYGKIRNLYDEIVRFKHMGSFLTAFEEVKPYFEMKKDELITYIDVAEDVADQFKILFADLLDAAAREQLMPVSADKAYVNYVLMSMIQVMNGPMLCTYNQKNAVDQEQQFAFIYRMLILALGNDQPIHINTCENRD